MYKLRIIYYYDIYVLSGQYICSVKNTNNNIRIKYQRKTSNIKFKA